MEGRLVTNNISRSASMYYLGTLLTFLLALVAIFMNTLYPFTPLQVSIMSMFVEGMPSSFVTFESSYAKPKEAIIPSILRNIIPNAATMAIIFVITLLMPFPLPTRHTMLYFVTIFLSLALVYHIFQPMNWKRVAVLMASGASLIGICYLFFKQLRLVHLGTQETQITVGLVVLSMGLLFILNKVSNHLIDRFFKGSLKTDVD
ncbi:hypothetical protein G7062_08430 [Erysipelothrix sp. HDW6C]|uniref:hypothetical protein n=1 Tax=Erysipelothrix sp. HDW6C TaxID=2714930 RepID=UPI00140B0832|nr:hypothetical protein [Erysipelothrix sp. HDW6C]QIK70318.1 hypothetical protein G7062_08430 [Erysipelothrix sp. HDW6C]